MQPNPNLQTASSHGEHIPKVSIGMPVYNGEKYMREAIDSVLAQTFTDFELVISDNASSDGTEAICREYARKDNRISYVRQPTNIGAQDNFNYLLEHARGEYFKWVAHDDYLEPSYLEMILQYLDGHNDVLLCTSDVRLIDDARQVLGVQHLEEIRDHKEWSDARRKIFSWSDHLGCTTCMAIYGVYRLNSIRTRNICKARGLCGRILGSEYPILNRIALLGRIVALPSVQMTYRVLEGSIGNSEGRSFSVLRYVNYIYYLLDAFRIVLFSTLDFKFKIPILATIVFVDLRAVLVGLFKVTVNKLIGPSATRRIKHAALRLLGRDER